MTWLYKGLIAISILILLYLISGILTTLITRLFHPLRNLNQKEKKIYLSFDDGIDERYTPLLLDVLKEHQVPATFFIMGNTITHNQEIIKRMKDEGHLLGLHSYEHKNQIIQTPWGLYNDYKKSMRAMCNTGSKIRYFRPPWGHLSFVGLILNMHYQLHCVYWNVIVQDWQKDTTKDIIKIKLEKQVQNQSVICLHDGRGKNEAPLETIAALKDMIPIWKKRGYRFEKVDQIF